MIQCQARIVLVLLRELTLNPLKTTYQKRSQIVSDLEAYSSSD